MNSIEGKALQIRLFRNVCKAMDSLHQSLLYRTEGKVLARVLGLKYELLMFLQDPKFVYVNYVCDPV